MKFNEDILKKFGLESKEETANKGNAALLQIMC